MILGGISFSAMSIGKRLYRENRKKHSICANLHRGPPASFFKFNINTIFNTIIAVLIGQKMVKMVEMVAVKKKWS